MGHHVRHEWAGRDGVDSDLVHSQFYAHVGRQSDDSSLACVVGDDGLLFFGGTAERASARYVDDRSAALFLHVNDHALREQPQTPNVHVEHFVPGLNGIFQSGCGPDDAGVVDQYVQVIGLIQDLIGEGIDVLLFADVGLDRDGLATVRFDFVDDRLTIFELPRCDEYRRAGLSEPFCDEPPNPSSAAGHEGRFVTQVEQLLYAHHFSKI